MDRRRLLLTLAAVGLFCCERTPPNSTDEIFLYRAVQKVAPGHLPLNQGPIGTCVAFGHAAAIDCRTAVKSMLGPFAKWLPASPESIYGGARNEGQGRISRSYADGSSGYDATRWLSRYGVLWQKEYSGADLSKYEVDRAKTWGAFGNGGKADGLDGPLDHEAKRKPIKAARVATLDELDTALRNGYPVTICSNVGFQSPRDSDGFCAARGSWGHCMVVLGKRQEGRAGYLIQNSWGPYIQGDGPGSTNKYRDQPDGSFYCEPIVMARILRQGDSWAIGDDKPFGRSTLPAWLTSREADDVPGVDPADDGREWFDTYDEAKAAADADGLPLVVYFTADWCGPCKQARPLVDEAVTAPGRVAAVVIDFDVEQEFAASLGVRKLPQALVYSAAGDGVRLIGLDELRRIGDYLKPGAN